MTLASLFRAGTTLLLIFAAGWSAARELPDARPESVGMSSERLARIAPAMQRYIDAELTPGVITAIMRLQKTQGAVTKKKRVRGTVV